jgi:GPH family glycoside/pentoside/hexuronide:cation symporter
VYTEICQGHYSFYRSLLLRLQPNDRKNVMTELQYFETAPEDKIFLSKKLIYGLGAFVNNILAVAIDGMVRVRNLGLGMNPALDGLFSVLPRLTDAITSPLMAYISD